MAERLESSDHSMENYKTSTSKRANKFRSKSFVERIRVSKSEADIRQTGLTLSKNQSAAYIKATKTKRTSKGDEDLDVILAQPINSLEWDPSCVIEELYADVESLRGVNEVERCRYRGFLDKLPIGQAKKTVMKGYKRRYFKIKEGSLFYYEMKQDVKPLGVLPLRAATISAENGTQVTIVDDKGRLLVLRVDQSEFLLWKRALTLESHHPTLLPGIVTPVDCHTVIIDIGACSVRAGYAIENSKPQLFFPSVFACDPESGEVMSVGSNAVIPENRVSLKLVYPWKHSNRMDKKVVKSSFLYYLVNYIFSELNADPALCSVIMTMEAAADEEKQMVGEVMFDQIGVRELHLQEQAVLSLYSYGASSGIVVDMGDRTTVVPIVSGFKVEGGVVKLPFGGNAVTESLTRMSSEKGIRYFSDTETYIMRYLKESIGYVSQDFQSDLESCSELTANFARAADVDRFNLPDHKKVLALDSPLFRAAEGFFSPSLWGKDVPTLQDSVWVAIQACAIDERKQMASHIYLSGAATLLTGFQERLQKELEKLSPTGYPIHVRASELRSHSAFIGATVLASLKTFPDTCVSSEEWHSNGLQSFSKMTS